MKNIDMTDAPALLPELTKRCHYGGEGFVLLNYNKPYAWLVPVGGMTNAEPNKDSLSNTAGQVGVESGSGGRTSENRAKRSVKNRGGRTASGKRNPPLGEGLQAQRS